MGASDARRANEWDDSSGKDKVTLAALHGSVKKLGVLGAIIVASAVIKMCAALLHRYVLWGDGLDTLYHVSGEISDFMDYVFPNSLSIVLSIVLRGQESVMQTLAFFVLIDIPLAYVCGRGVERLRRRYGVIRVASAYALASVAACLFFIVLFFRL